MPPEMHFESPNDLRDAIMLFQKSRLSSNEQSCRYPNIMPPNGKFERVRISSGEYLLLPCANDYAYLFRGQGRDYPKNLPTLYRQSKTASELFLQRLKMVEFQIFLQQLPQVQFFELNKYHIDYVGLAQHYGFQTEVIDLTSSIDVALFFAMCDLQKGETEYICKTEDRSYIGYIYCVPTYKLMMQNDQIGETFWGTKISAIGLQPFERPGVQKGFSYWLNGSEELKSLVYSFSYTRKDSETIFLKFSQGKAIWQDDAIAKIARSINDSKQFSYNAFNTCVKKYGDKKTDYRKHLKEEGYILCKSPKYRFSSDVQLVRDEYERDGNMLFQKNIVLRRIVSANGATIRRCLSLHEISTFILLHLIESGCPAPGGYNSGDELGKELETQSIVMRSIDENLRSQTHPDPITGKVTKWMGNWKEELKIDLNKEKQFGVKIVRTGR